jgi:RNA 2',3'-cyclic 3'-phosphodiesterase
MSLTSGRQMAAGVFFALLPPANAGTRIAQIAQRLHHEHGLHGEPLEKQRFHVTLLYLGQDLPDDVVAAAAEAAAAVAVSQFDVAFDRAMSLPRGGKQPLALCGGDGIAKARTLQEALRAAMRRIGLPGIAYQPHVTLLYNERRVEEQAVEAVTWTVREFVLVRSLIGLRRHEALGWWPLHAALSR